MSTWSRITTKQARGVAHRVNDTALEYVIVLLRVSSLVLAALALVSVFAWIWAGGWRWGATLGASLALAGGFGWLGFWHFGNKEWFRGDEE